MMRAEWFWGAVTVLVVAVMAAGCWIIDAENRAEWVTEVKALERAIWYANRIELARGIFGFYSATANLETERLAIATARSSPLVGVYHRISGDRKVVGTFEITAYLVPRDGGYLDTRDRPLHHGIIAVDPRYFPLDGIVYVPALREFDAMFAPTYTLRPPPELEPAVEDPAVVLSDAVSQIELHPEIPPETEQADPLGVEPETAAEETVAGGDDMARDFYRARCHGWFLVRDTGEKVKGRKIDVAVFSEAAYNYITTRFPKQRDPATGKWKNQVEIYRLRNDPAWGRPPLDTWEASPPAPCVIYD